MRVPQRSHPPFGLNMTPMIDVVFQLLIFFVCTVEFQRSEDVLEAFIPPEAGAGAKRSPEELDLGRVEIGIANEGIEVKFQGRVGRFALADAESDKSPLRQQLETWQRIDAKIPIRIACEPEVATGIPLRVYDLCLQTGFQDLGLVNPR